MLSSDIAKLTDEYATELRAFVRDNDLPSKWFKVIDHVAFKFRGRKDYEAGVELFRPLASQISCIDMDGRSLATAQLKEGLKVGDFGSVKWIEIMEPRPAKIGKDLVGFEHVEFYYPNFEEIKTVLSQHDIAYTLQTNPGHTWVNIVINDIGQELKLNNRTLGDVVTEEIKNGESYVI
jgi:predicted metalloenzyme YecM